LASGRKNLSVVPGDPKNKKITYREDMDYLWNFYKEINNGSSLFS